MTHTKILGSLAVLTACMSVASAAVLHVGPTRTYTRVMDAYDAARDGDVIEIDSGTYYRDEGWVLINRKNNLTFRGVGPTRPILDAGGELLRGKRHLRHRHRHAEHDDRKPRDGKRAAALA